jgi:hypothetical protein
MERVPQPDGNETEQIITRIGSNFHALASKVALFGNVESVNVGRQGDQILEHLEQLVPLVHRMSERLDVIDGRLDYLTREVARLQPLVPQVQQLHDSLQTGLQQV